MASRMRLRTIGSAVAMSLIVGPAVVALSQAPAHASSTIGGSIVRSEVLQRAQYWVNQGYTYSTSQPDAPDPGGKTYRRDCSGLVSMAWHLNVSRGYLTNEFLSMAQANNTMHTITLDELQPGDAIVQDDDGSGPDGHIELFAFWKDANHQDGAYVYSFNRTGETVENPYANSNFGYLGFDSWSDLTSYQAIRYNKILDDQQQPPPPPPVSPPGSPSIVFNNSVNVFARGTDGALADYYFDGTWHVQGLGGQISGDPTAVVNNNSVNVFARGNDGALANYYFDGAWHVQGLGGQITGKPTAAVYGASLNVFAQGIDGALANYYYDSTWHVQGLGGQITSNPTVVVYGNSVNVFARGNDGALANYYFDGTWHVQGLGGQITSDTAAVVYNNSVNVFARGADGALANYYFDGTWHVQGLGGQITGV
jgi:Repeat of unknown function (DUF346)